MLNKVMLLCLIIDWGKLMNAIFFDYFVLVFYFVRKNNDDDFI